MTTPTRQPGEQRPLLDRAPSERYEVRPDRPAEDPSLARLRAPLAVVLGGALAFVILGGIMTITAGLVLVAAVVGWLIGTLVSPPWRAGLIGLTTVVLGLLGIWAFGRIEGGVLDPITYHAEVQGPVLVVLELLVGGGLAAAASR